MIPLSSTQMGGITRGYKILILSTQFKQGKVHRILVTPLQSRSNSTEKYLCFHCSVSTEMGGITEGSNILIPPLSFITHWDGREIEKNPWAVL